MSVLYIEDEYISNMHYISAVKREFPNSRWVNNIGKAREALSENGLYRVILCDGYIIDKNTPVNEQYDAGIEFLRQLRKELGNACPLLILFSVRHDLPMRQLNDEGIVVLLKHITADVLVAQIRELAKKDGFKI